MSNDSQDNQNYCNQIDTNSIYEIKMNFEAIKFHIKYIQPHIDKNISRSVLDSNKVENIPPASIIDDCSKDSIKKSEKANFDELTLAHDILEQQLECSQQILNAMGKSSADILGAKDVMDRVLSEIDVTKKTITSYERQKARGQVTVAISFIFFLLVCAFILYNRLPIKVIVKKIYRIYNEVQNLF